MWIRCSKTPLVLTRHTAGGILPYKATNLVHKKQNCLYYLSGRFEILSALCGICNGISALRDICNGVVMVFQLFI